MSVPNSSLVVVVVLAFAFYLIYSQNKNSCPPCPPCRNESRSSGNLVESMENLTNQPQQTQQSQQLQQMQQMQQMQQLQQMQQTRQPAPPQITNVVIDQDNDPYSDAIKKQDLYTMYDPLTYPQLRLPREVLERYNEFYNRTGTYPPFNQSSQPYVFDNPVLNGVLIKQVDPTDPFTDDVPTSVPLFRVKSVKNSNRYYYYILDQRYLSKVELKIPLDNVKINGKYYDKADYYGLPEIFDGDVIENIPIYKDAKFRVTLYKTYSFP